MSMWSFTLKTFSPNNREPANVVNFCLLKVCKVFSGLSSVTIFVVDEELIKSDGFVARVKGRVCVAY